MEISILQSNTDEAFDLPIEQNINAPQFCEDQMVDILHNFHLIFPYSPNQLNALERFSRVYLVSSNKSTLFSQ